MKSKNDDTRATLNIAIIGMGCLFPRSSDLKSYWQVLFRGHDAIAEVPETHWSRSDYFDPNPKKQDHLYCTRGGYLTPVNFDPTEFGIPPSNLEATDTSQLLGLVAAKMALADAGYGIGANPYKEKTSVILGVTGTQELVISLGSRLGHPQWRKALRESGIDESTAETVINKISDAYVPWQENSFPGLLGNVVAGRICNRFDLGGTNCVVDAACASSLGAVNLSLLELRTKKSDLVVSGGVDTINDVFMHMCFSQTQLLSPSGDLRAFSENADGTVLGEGIGLLVLKRLEDAKRDGDRIYAVIRGIGTSSDGKSQSIYAPSVDGQVKALRQAYREAQIDPGTIELLEAHGTGTSVGDDVEFNSLQRVFSTGAKRQRNWCALGSVKSNIGHTKAAAGAAGLIKAALALHHKVLPATIKADFSDSRLDFENSPFYLSLNSRPWLSNEGHPRRCGVSSFGFGGSNYHVLLEEYQREKDIPSWDGSVEIIAFSTDTALELQNLLKKLEAFLDRDSSQEALARKAENTRLRFSSKNAFRLLMVCESALDLKKSISNVLANFPSLIEEAFWHDGNSYFGKGESKGSIAFLFPGQGSQYPYMGRDLVCTFPAAMAALESADRQFQTETMLRDLIYPKFYVEKEKKRFETALQPTHIAQPAIGAVSLAMLNVLHDFSLRPGAVGGHSYGELSALCAAGCLDDDTFIDLSITRGALMASCGSNDREPNGTMLAVKAPLESIERIIRKADLGVVLANRNSPEQGVLSGTMTAIEQVAQLFKETGWRAVRLPVAAAFHSPLVEAAAEPFREKLKHVVIRKPSIPVFSNTTGKKYSKKVSNIRHLMGEHLTHPVNFVQEIESMYKSGVRTFVEVGPRTVLTGLVKSILNHHEYHAMALDASSGRRSGTFDLAHLLCHLSAIGHNPSMDRWEQPVPPKSDQRMSIPLSGANYRRPVKPAQKERGTKPMSIQTSRHDADRQTDGESPVGKPDRPASTPQNASRAFQGNSSSTMAGAGNPDPQVINEALKMVREGLRTMQTLQIQTAELHKQFLETQRQATLAIGEMLKNTRLFTGEPTAPGPLPGDRLPSPSASPGHSTTSPGPDQANGISAGSSAAGLLSKSMESILAVVSELTGYPPEMLEPDMDMEADLGIDSIKRVEILSTLEERVPGLPPVSPEIMGEMKTLGQIAQYFDTPPAAAGGEDRAEPASAGPESPTAGGAIRETMIAVVSELTGYPPEMLEPDMDMEADLGIDSIKRVEILSTLEERVPGLPPVSPEIMGEMRTLGQITQYFLDAQHFPSPGLSPARSVHGHRQEKNAKEDSAGSLQLPDRFVLSFRKTPLDTNRTRHIAEGARFLVSKDRAGFCDLIVGKLTALGINASSVTLKSLIDHPVPEDIGGLVIVSESASSEKHCKTLDPDTFLRDTFQAAKKHAGALIAAARDRGAVFATVTCLDGLFGTGGGALRFPELGGAAAVAKTACLEWENVLCRAIDISPGSLASADAAGQIVQELIFPNPSDPVEIALKNGFRYTPILVPAPYPDRPTDLGSRDVLVLSGGAKGIAATVAIDFARRYRPKMLLLGRSPAPAPEPPWLRSLQSESEIKRAILENEFNGRKTSPKTLQARYLQHRNNRNILATLEKIQSHGSAVTYVSLDVRDTDAVAAAVTAFRRKNGPVTGLIHAAGVLADRRIVDKSRKQFAAVYETKIHGLRALLASVRKDPLKHVVLFSSVTARMGNVGQVDYAVANEVMNKIAHQVRHMWKDCRAVSLNWGPWDGGMVDASLKKVFQRQGISLISPESGARALAHEFGGGPDQPVEIVIGSVRMGTETTRLQIIAGGKKDEPSERVGDGLSLAFTRELDLHRYPVLASHILDGNPVVPFALMTEWVAQSALHANPGLRLVGIDDMRLLQGIKLDFGKKMVRLLAGRPRKRGPYFEVDVEIRNGFQAGRDILHSRARAILGETASVPLPPDHSLRRMPETSYHRTVEEVYKNVLFHGFDLQGIRKIRSLSHGGMVADVATAPVPSRWMTEPMRNQWLGDPLVLDSAFQMGSLWCYENRGKVSLPVYASRYRQHCRRFPENGVTAILEIMASSDSKMKGNFIFLDANRAVIAEIHGYEAVMDENLYRAFKPEKVVAGS